MNIKIAYKYLIAFYYFFSFMLHCQGQSFSIDIEDTLRINAYLTTKENNLYFTAGSGQLSIILSKIDSVGNRLWSNEFKEVRARNHSILEKHRSNKHILTASNDICFARNYIENDSAKFLVSRVTSNGEVLWTNGFKYFSAGTNSHPTLFALDNQKIRVISCFRNSSKSKLIGIVDLNEDGSIFEFITYRDEYLPDSRIHETKLPNSNLALIKNLDSEPKSIVSIYSNSLSFIDGVSVEANITDIVFIDGRYYALGNDSNYSINNLWSNDGTSFPVVLCFDEELNLIWSRKIDLPTEWFNTGFDVSGDNIVLKLKGANENKNTEFLIMINANGEIEDSHRFTSDDSFSTFQPIGTINQDVTMIVQEDTLFGAEKKMIRLGGNFDEIDCYLDDYCLNIEDTSIEVAEENNHNMRIIFPGLDTFKFQNDIQFSDFEKKIDSCIDNFPAFPVPLFDHPDTICTDSPLLFEKLQNTGADSVIWNLIGSNMEQNYEFKPTGIKYDKEGEYSITQTIYQNGCANSYDSNIAVLKPVSNFSNDTITLCRDATVRLNVEAEGALSYLWNDGSSSSEKLITNAGTYSVEIKNESCRQEINFNVDAFDYSLITSDLGTDTTICKETPLVLTPIINENSQFTWSDGKEQLNRIIKEAGLYELTTSLEGCSAKTSIYVEAYSCASRIYIPNSFSPNDDGVNDIFQPLGEDFEIIEFKILDKWGNLVHDSITPWTGRSRGKDYFPKDVYVYLLKVKNIRLNKEEYFKGDLTLLK